MSDFLSPESSDELKAKAKRALKVKRNRVLALPFASQLTEFSPNDSSVAAAEPIRHDELFPYLFPSLSVQNIIQMCTHLVALEPLLNEAPPSILKYASCAYHFSFCNLWRCLAAVLHFAHRIAESTTSFPISLACAEYLRSAFSANLEISQ